MIRPEKHIWPILKKLSLATFLLTPLAACQSVSDYTGAADFKRAEVSTERFSHVIALNEESTLTAAEWQRVQAFITYYQVGYGDVIAFDIGDQNLDVSALAAALEKQGLSVSPTPVVWGKAPQQNSLTMVVDRYRASTPDCVQNPEHIDGAHHIESRYFACSNQSLLNAMVAHKNHLVVGAGDQAANAKGAARAINGQSPRGTVSTSSTQSSTSSSFGISLSATKGN